jgi:hypothetical protein|tara:strand:- start:71 stop:367 length:297 start_codon:yes stop_codon:yes gene_type:complete
MTEKNKTLLILVLGVLFYIIIFFKSDGYGEFLRFEIRDTWVWNFFESIIEVFTNGPDQEIAYIFWWILSSVYFYYLWIKRKFITDYIFKILKKFYSKV